jgi:glutamate/tyrosine decarboxylase-like PLP-dependent enzyme
MKDVLNEAARRSISYLESLSQRSVAPTAAGVANLEQFREPQPAKASDPQATLRLLDDVGSAGTMAMAGSRFFGFVIGGSLPVALGANWLVGAWDQNSVLHRTSPTSAILEDVALGWLVDCLGLPKGTGGAFVTGATVANFSALAAARHAVLAQAGWNVEAEGLFGAPPITVVVGEEVHPSVTKALGMLGFGRNRLAKVPVDAQGRMRADKFPAISGPAIVCLQAGNVNTGALDPALEIIPNAKAAGAWVHVDAAFGLWAAVAPSRANYFKGFAAADSWATDAHKWLNVPYDSGIAFVRNPDALKAAMAVTAEYLPTQTEFRNPSDYTPELSRRSRGVEIWAVLRSLGREGLTELIERNCAQARRFAALLAEAGFEILNEVVLNQVLVSFGTPEETRKTIEAIQLDGTCWAGITVWQGRTAMRISVSSWATTDADVELSAEAMIRCARSAKQR